MSMRKQLYQWNINNQVNGFPVVGTGTLFQNIQGIPISIFIGGIGNNITEPAATKATQFITIDSIRGSPSFFLSGAGVLARYNYLASLQTVSTALDRTSYSTVNTNINAGFTVNTSASFGGTGLPAPTANSGIGTGATIQVQASGGALSPNPNFAFRATGGSGYAVGDVLSWAGGAVLAAVPNISGFTGFTLIYTITAADLNAYVDVASIPLDAGSTSANPKYTPTTVGSADAPDGKPELTFQGTHINPFTSIAGPLMFMQVVINTTNYFDETDGTTGPGLPATSSPCPETTACRTSFEFESPIYILPGQQWDVRVALYNDSRADIGSVNKGYNGESGIGVEDLCCLVQYTLYDGPDALVANKLVEMGVAVVPENVDWYKRQLLEGTL